MAKVTTYLLLSNIKGRGELDDHPVLKESGFEVEKVFEQKKNGNRAVRLSIQCPIEENESREETAIAISEAFPESTVTLCAVEERLGQIEHVYASIFKDGDHAGEIEHGALYNVGKP